MGFWNRKSDDPLLKIFLEKYHLNLLSIPRENSRVGDLYIEDENTHILSSVGSIKNFLDPPFNLPSIETNETMGHIIGTASKDISIKAGFDFLEGFLNVLGGSGIGANIRGTYENNKKKGISFSFENPKRDSLEPITFGANIIKHQFNTENPFYSENNKYYIVTAIAKSNSITIETLGDEKQLMDIDANIAKVIDLSSGIAFQNNGIGKITFKGEKDLVFGVELFELLFDNKMRKFKMKSSQDSKSIRGSEFAFIGGTNGDAFIELKDNVNT